MTPGTTELTRADQPYRDGRRGRQCTTAWSRVHQDERGSVAIVNVIAVMFCCLLVVWITNIGLVTHQKVEAQNAADAMAYSGTLWLARGMNAVTATNHVIGEMMSFVILHEAIGGQRLEGGVDGPADTERVDAALDAAQAAASALGARTPAYETVRQQEGIYADRTLLDSKVQLKRWLTWIYLMKAAAKAMQSSSLPPVVAAGVALEALMDAFEPVIRWEYVILKELHAVAVALLPLKMVVRDRMLPDAKKYTTYVRDTVPELAEQTARHIAESSGGAGTLFPMKPELPIVLDPHAHAMAPVFDDSFYLRAPRQSCGCPSAQADDIRAQIVKTSQLARASWPWVNYHRQPILEVLAWLCPFSGASDHYFEHTAGASKYLLNKLQLSLYHDLGLYVMKNYPAPDKGYGRWTRDPVRADNMLSLVGLFHYNKPAVIGEPLFFKQAHEDGRITLAQGLLYNANEQQRAEYRIDLSCKRIVPVRQANVGYDTLNWLSGSRQTERGCRDNGTPYNADDDPFENRPFELVGIGLPPEYPQILINWQAKLVPLTSNRLQQLRESGSIPGEFRAMTMRLLPVTFQSLRTH